MPVVVGVGATASGTTNITPAYPVGYTAVVNDVGITLIETASEAIAAPTNWAIMAGITESTGTPTRLAAYWRRFTAGALAPTYTTAANHKVGRMIVIRGCRTTGNPHQAAAGTTEPVADTSVAIPGDTTTLPDTLCLYAFGTGQDISSTAGATGWANASLLGVVERMDNWATAGDGGGFAMATGGKVAPGATGTMTATLSLTANVKTLMIITLVGETIPPPLTMAPHRIR